MTPLSHVVRIPNGQVLGCSVYGMPDFRLPVFYFHGFPGSRLEARFAHEAAVSAGITLVGIDRPGFGRSSPQPGRTLLGWAQSMRLLAQHFRITEFSVLGVSGGAPYALACAYALRPLVRRAMVVSALGQVAEKPIPARMVRSNRTILQLAKVSPFLAQSAVRGITTYLARRPSRLVRLLSLEIPLCDRNLITSAERLPFFNDSYTEAFSQGVDCAVEDFRVLTSPWGFNPKEIQTPVEIWHGELDTYVPIEMSRELAALIPDSHLVAVPDGGHFMVLQQFREVFDLLRL